MQASTHLADVKHQAGAPVASGPRPHFPTVAPSTDEAGRTYSGPSLDEAHDIARLTRAAFEDWRRTSFAERARLMKAAAATLWRRQGEFAELMTAETGKLLKDGLAEAEECASNCDYCAE